MMPIISQIEISDPPGEKATLCTQRNGTLQSATF